MKNKLTFFCLLTIIFILGVQTIPFAQNFTKRIVGYYPAWAVYGRDYHVPDILADKISHINYAFANLDTITGGIKLGDAYADTGKIYAEYGDTGVT